MDLAQIRELLKIVAESSVAEVEVEEDGVKLVVRKNAATVMMHPSPAFLPYGSGYGAPMYPPMYSQAPGVPAPAPMPNPMPAPPSLSHAAAVPTFAEPAKEEPLPDDDGTIVHAPIVGTFYESPAPDADAFVKVGDTVQIGDVLCIIEAMKLMNEIESEVAGTVRKILAQNTEPVEYDQPLFVIKPA